MDETAPSLPAEPPRAGLASDEALLETVTIDRRIHVRWWVAASPAVVLGLGLRHRAPRVVDFGRAAAAGVEVLDRRAGGGAVLLDEHVLCGAVCVPLPDPRVGDDLTESYRWLGEWLVQQVGVRDARRVGVAEARADIAALRARGDTLSGLLLATCYGALSPHEVVDGQGRKLIGLAQVRRRDAVLFQVGILLRDQSALADYLSAEPGVRADLRAELRQRSVGLEAFTGRSASAVALAVAGARPCAR